MTYIYLRLLGTGPRQRVNWSGTAEQLAEMRRNTKRFNARKQRALEVAAR
jgi:hypothetical protein